MKKGLGILNLLGAALGPAIQSELLKANNGDNLSDYLALQAQREKTPGSIVNPNTTLAQNDINIAKARSVGNNDLLGNILTGLGMGTSMLSTSLTPEMAVGGSIGDSNTAENILKGLMRNGNPDGVSIQDAPKPVNVEDGEVIDRANGGLEMVEGNTHEQGGEFTTMLPETPTQKGDVVFSDTLAKDGKSMAKRKLSREKELKKLEKQLEKNPSDTLLKQTIERLKEQITKEEEQDIALQNAAQKIYGMGEVPQFSVGGTYSNGDNSLSTFLDMFQKLNKESKKTNGVEEGEKDPAVKFNTAGLPTFGDALGIFGNIVNATSPWKLANLQRGADTPNTNFYEGLTKEMDKRFDNQKDLIQQRTALADKEIDENFVAAMDSINNTARSSSTKTANNIAAFLGANAAKNKNLEALLSGVSSVELAQTQSALNSLQAEASNAKAASDANIEDRDAYYNALQRGALDFGKGSSAIGSNINQILKREVNSNFLNNLSNSVGINVMTGKILYKNDMPVNPEIFTAMKITEEDFKKKSKKEQNALIQKYLQDVMFKSMNTTTKEEEDKN